MDGDSSKSITFVNIIWRNRTLENRTIEKLNLLASEKQRRFFLTIDIGELDGGVA